MFTEYEPSAGSNPAASIKQVFRSYLPILAALSSRRLTVTICLRPCSTLPRHLEDTSEEFTGSQIGIKKGVWGESRIDFESIVEEEAAQGCASSPDFDFLSLSPGKPNDLVRQIPPGRRSSC